jgi:hypothetical protein
MAKAQISTRFRIGKLKYPVGCVSFTLRLMHRYSSKTRESPYLQLAHRRSWLAKVAVVGTRRGIGYTQL